MKKILYSNQLSIKYSEDEVIINGKKVVDIEGITSEEYAYQSMRDFYKKGLSCHIENLVFLSGAGTSVGIGEGVKGKTMYGLWSAVKNSIGIEELKVFCESIQFEYSEDDLDLEALLSRAITAKKFINDPKIEEIINKIEETIRNECTLILPENSPHELFLHKSTARKLKYPRLKIFTFNYDTLFEQVAAKYGYVIIDGFSFSYPRKFNGAYFDYDIVLRSNSRISQEENYLARVFQLYKPHGSLDWERIDDYVIKSEKPKKPVMIYPKDSKYESSYEQPFFEMMSRLQHELRKPNTYLITVGFSFGDKHIASMINEAINSNPSFRILIVNPDVEKDNKYCYYKNLAKGKNNISLVNDTFEGFANNFPYSEIYSVYNSYLDEEERGND